MVKGSALMEGSTIERVVCGRSLADLLVGLMKKPNVEDARKSSMVKGLIHGSTLDLMLRPYATDTTNEILENGPAQF